MVYGSTTQTLEERNRRRNSLVAVAAEVLVTVLRSRVQSSHRLLREDWMTLPILVCVYLDQANGKTTTFKSLHLDTGLTPWAIRERVQRLAAAALITNERIAGQARTRHVVLTPVGSNLVRSILSAIDGRVFEGSLDPGLMRLDPHSIPNLR